MLEYIEKIKRLLRDNYGFKVTGGTENDPLLDGPDGEYPMTIDGKVDNVLITDGKIYCCRFAGSSQAS